MNICALLFIFNQFCASYYFYSYNFRIGFCDRQLNNFFFTFQVAGQSCAKSINFACCGSKLISDIFVAIAKKFSTSCVVATFNVLNFSFFVMYLYFHNTL